MIFMLCHRAGDRLVQHCLFYYTLTGEEVKFSTRFPLVSAQARNCDSSRQVSFHTGTLQHLT